MAKVAINKKESRIETVFYATDLGAPFKVALHDCVTTTYDTSTNEVLNYHIPDFDALVDAVIMTRLLHDQKLSGAELKFLRRAAGLKQIELARLINLDPSTLSRIEKGEQTLGPASEKIARGCLFKAAGQRQKINKAVHKMRFEELTDKLFGDFVPVPARDANDELELSFYRTPRTPEAANDDCGDWTEEPVSIVAI